MKHLDDYRKSIECYDAQCIELLEKLDKMDPTTEEYHKVEESLKTMLEIKQIEVANMNATKESLIPGWVTTIASLLGAVGSIGAILATEYKGAVIGSTATSILNKIKFK